jgi:hypothetical protein
LSGIAGHKMPGTAERCTNARTPEPGD